MPETSSSSAAYRPPNNSGISFSMWRKLFFNASPKYWLLGVVLLLCRLLALLPHAILLRMGRGLGWLIARLGKRVRHIAETNIGLCYPELSDKEKQDRLEASFSELGISIAETLEVWFGNPAKRFWPNIELKGADHWQAALDSGRGIIMLSCHYGSLDLNAALGGYLARKDRTFAFTYRQPSDPIVDAFLRDARHQYGNHFFSVSNLVGITRTLKRNGVVWYAPDIEVKNKNTVFADFLAVPASTTIALSRLAAATNALVVPYGHYRSADNTRYCLQIYAAIASFPSGDAQSDTRQINREIERIIAPHPERYWWSIKRFKNRPSGEKPVY
ncbi:lysophospholipid acyltransferase family protein [Teredinibacter haidensis]|uniref:lysophospholipid acyltransferase family protein n=1 Tax=Teredinibacter haidensis TaxID=2731755 RepID=UPI000AE10EFF|nr:lysophospholipid acyltransferase family protein [Teredinibacter haidensis]